MDLDRDIRRDADSSFAPETVAAGALLPYEGRARLLRPDGLRDEALAAQHDGWLSPDNPVLVRGEARILPLAWRGDPSRDGSSASPEEIAAFASQITDLGVYLTGGWRSLDELEQHNGDSLASYAEALRTAGATAARVWTLSETLGMALIWAGSDDAGDASLALHLVPASWVSERYGGSKPVAGIDVRWTWADVVALADAR